MTVKPHIFLSIREENTSQHLKKFEGHFDSSEDLFAQVLQSNLRGYFCNRINLKPFILHSQSILFVFTSKLLNTHCICLLQKQQ